MNKPTAREIVFDTETTGLKANHPDEPDRIVELGAIEIIDFKPTGRVFHQYINPERHIPENVVKIHGIDNARVADEPTFKDIAQDFFDFIGDDSTLVAHNAVFDMEFINAEFVRAGLPEISKTRVIDTLKMAQKKFRGQKNSLDALCKRYGVDNSNREFHGALLDSELLLEVYFELCGGAQQGLALADTATTEQSPSTTPQDIIKGQYREPRPHSPSDDEKQAHQAFIKATIEDPIWYKNG